MFKYWKKVKSKSINSTNDSNKIQESTPLSKAVEENVSELKKSYKDCSDVIYRHFNIAKKYKAYLIYIEGLVNIEEIDTNVLTPLMEEKALNINTIAELIEEEISISNAKEIHTYSECIEELSLGNPIIIINGYKTAISLSLSKMEKRSIQEPAAESIVRGPREGFVEQITINGSLLRRRIRSPMLKMQTLEIGKYTKTKVLIAYINGIAVENLVNEVITRLKMIEIDGVLESGVLEEFIEDNYLSPFPQVMVTERPDVTISNLLEGRVAILVDGTPFAMIVPITLFSLLQSNEDYYSRFLISTLIRWLRYFLLVISLVLPALYVAVITFHQEMVPTFLLISMAASREQVPFPALVEALIMEITFEALREAGLRLPKQVGSAVSIVGALVIGESAVTAGIVSAPMVIVVAFTGIASFTIPRNSLAHAIRILRFPMILLAGFLGLLGIMLGIITIIIHLSSLRSFGIPYLSPLAPMNGSELKDVVIRSPWWNLNTRPHYARKNNKYRQPPQQKSRPN